MLGRQWHIMPKYGQANEIYIVDSDFKGRIWQGALDGLKRKRLIWMRAPEPVGKNAKQQLIDMGPQPVDAMQLIINSGLGHLPRICLKNRKLGIFICLFKKRS